MLAPSRRATAGVRSGLILCGIEKSKRHLTTRPAEKSQTAASPAVAFVPRVRAVASAFEQSARGLLRLFERADATVELHLVDGARDLADEGRRPESHLKKVSAHQNRRGRPAFDRELARARDEPLLRLRRVPALARNPRRVAPQTIGLRDAVQEFEFASARESSERAVGYLLALSVELAGLEVIAHEGDDLRAHVVAVEREELQAFEERNGRLNARLLVTARAYAPLDELGRRRLAEVVAQSGQHHRQLPRVVEVFNEFARAVADEKGVLKNFSLRMPLFFLRHALERFEFGEELAGRAESFEPTEAD